MTRLEEVKEILKVKKEEVANLYEAYNKMTIEIGHTDLHVDRVKKIEEKKAIQKRMLEIEEERRELLKLKGQLKREAKEKANLEA